MQLRETILETIHEIAEQNDVTLAEIHDESELLNTGLDSLGFAMVVTMLEVKLGYDPFVIMEEPVYPSTFGEFVEIYRRHDPTTAQEA